MVKIGDKVQHIDGLFTTPQKVKNIKSINDKKYAFFEGGGFWEISRLEPINEIPNDIIGELPDKFKRHPH